MKTVLVRQGDSTDLGSIISFDHLAYTASRLKFIKRILSSGCCYVAKYENTIVGYGSLEYSFYDYGFISMLYINPSYQRQGFGIQLMKYFESVCKTEKLFTSTNQSNKPMQALLENLGYHPSGIIENLDENDLELIYFKKLII